MPDRRRYRLLVEYDGGEFYGWQYQVDRRTVQGVLEAALESLYGHPVRIQGAGRTDAGVHALGQVAHFDAPARFSEDTIRNALNYYLPDDVRIQKAAAVSTEFHARFHARWRWYRYRIFLEDKAVERQYGWRLRFPFDEVKLQFTADRIVGAHDFVCFAASDHNVKDHHCRVFAAKWLQKGTEWHFHIIADRFLRHMVRRLTGTMLDVARGRFSQQDFERFLESGRKFSNLFTIPPQGLCLWRVGYGDFPYLEQNSEDVPNFPFPINR